MGRGFESVRMGVKEVSERWLKASRALKKEDQVYGRISCVLFYSPVRPLLKTLWPPLGRPFGREPDGPRG